MQGTKIKILKILPIEEFKDFKDRLFKDRDIVIDKNIITAKANAYVDFTIELGKVMYIYENKDDLEETIQYFKYFNE